MYSLLIEEYPFHTIFFDSVQLLSLFLFWNLFFLTLKPVSYILFALKKILLLYSISTAFSLGRV
jgi:hypothetical protein